MSEATFLTEAELARGLDTLRSAPTDEGRLELIVRRPAKETREVLDEGVLDLEVGLAGDNWRTRGSSKTPDGSAHPEMQLNLMNVRVTALIAGGDRSRWPLAGDQLYVDLDLSSDNLPPGTRLSIGDALIEVTAMPHRGCKKFAERFGVEAVKFVNSEEGCRRNFRGINAKVVRGGAIRVGDAIRKSVETGGL